MKKLIFAVATTAILASAASAQDTKIEVHERLANYLTDAKGMALYTFDKDTLNVSNCKGGCLEKWPKALDANKSQLSYEKHPLYYFFKDSKAGDINGNNKKGVWHLVYLNKAFKANSDIKKSEKQNSQKYLTDDKGIALYTFDKDTKNSSKCVSGCIKKWPAFTADIKNLPTGLNSKDFTEIKREDGAMQIAYMGKPLYYFFKDKTAQDTKGDWVKGVWHLVDIAK